MPCSNASDWRAPSRSYAATFGGQRALALHLQAPDEAGGNHEGHHDGRSGDAMAGDELARAIPGGVGRRTDRQSAAIARQVVAKGGDSTVAIGDLVGGCLRDDAGEFRVDRLLPEGFAQHHAQTVDVGGDAHRPSRSLFRTRVAGREHARRTLQVGIAGGDELGDAEVEQLDATLVGDHHVRGFEVAMDHQVLVGMLHGGTDALDQRDAGVAIRLPYLQIGGQGLAAHIFDDEIGLPGFGFSAIDQACDIGMVELGKDLPFLPQPAHAVLRGKTANQLDRGLLGEATLVAFGQQHRAHAARSEFAHDPPGTNALAAQLRRDRGGGIAAQRDIDTGIRLGVGVEQGAQA